MWLVSNHGMTIIRQLNGDIFNHVSLLLCFWAEAHRNEFCIYMRECLLARFGVLCYCISFTSLQWTWHTTMYSLNDKTGEYLNTSWYAIILDFLTRCHVCVEVANFRCARVWCCGLLQCRCFVPLWQLYASFCDRKKESHWISLMRNASETAMLAKTAHLLFHNVKMSLRAVPSLQILDLGENGWQSM